MYKYLMFVTLMCVSSLATANVHVLGEARKEPTKEERRAKCEAVVEDFSTKTQLGNLNILTCYKPKFSDRYTISVQGIEYKLEADVAVTRTIVFSDYSNRYEVK